MTDLHLCPGPSSWQPAYRYQVAAENVEVWIETSPHRLGWCCRCRRHRRLANMLIGVQAYYDPVWRCVECPPQPKRRRARR